MQFQLNNFGGGGCGGCLTLIGFLVVVFIFMSMCGIVFR